MNHPIHNDVLRAVAILAATALLASCTDTIDPLGPTPIADLTASDAQSWCETFESRWHAPPPADGPVEPDGTVINGLPYKGEVSYPSAWFDGLCMMQLPVDQCVANLTRNPCEATLAQLDDCMDEAFATDNNTNFEACTAFHATPSCAETILATKPPTPPPGEVSTYCVLPPVR